MAISGIANFKVIFVPVGVQKWLNLKLCKNYRDSPLLSLSTTIKCEFNISNIFEDIIIIRLKF